MEKKTEATIRVVLKEVMEPLRKENEDLIDQLKACYHVVNKAQGSASLEGINDRLDCLQEHHQRMVKFEEKRAEVMAGLIAGMAWKFGRS